MSSILDPLCCGLAKVLLHEMSKEKFSTDLLEEFICYFGKVTSVLKRNITKMSTSMQQSGKNHLEEKQKFGGIFKREV